MNVLSFVVFAVLQILFLPFAILGVVIVGYRQMVMSKRLGTSQTAIETLNGRGTMHVFGMRDDEVAARIASVLPNTSTFGLWLCLFPLRVKHKISGRYFGYRRIQRLRVPQCLYPLAYSSRRLCHLILIRVPA